MTPSYSSNVTPDWSLQNDQSLGLLMAPPWIMTQSDMRSPFLRPSLCDYCANLITEDDVLIGDKGKWFCSHCFAPTSLQTASLSCLDRVTIPNPHFWFGVSGVGLLSLSFLFWRNLKFLISAFGLTAVVAVGLLIFQKTRPKNPESTMALWEAISCMDTKEDIALFVKALVLTETSHQDPFIDALRCITPTEDRWLYLMPFDAVLHRLDACAQGSMKSVIHHIRQAINTHITFDLEVLTLAQARAYLALVRGSARPYHITIKGCTPIALDTLDFGTQCLTLCIQDMTVTALHPSIWQVREALILDNLSGLERLPEVLTSIDTPCSIAIEHCRDLVCLPRTIAKRALCHLSLKGCCRLQKLPTTLKSFLMQGGVNLEDTGVETAFRRVLRSCEAIDSLLTDQSTRLMLHQPCVLPQFSPWPYLLSFAGLACILIHRPKHILAFVAYAVVTVLGVKIVSAVPCASRSTNNVEAVWQLLHKKGLEQQWDWDRLWRCTFPQQDCYEACVPRAVFDFVEGWMHACKGDYAHPIGAKIGAIARCKGGSAYLRTLSKLPFHAMLNQFEADACTALQSDIAAFRSYFSTIAFNLEDIALTSILPDALEAYFQLMACGCEADITLDCGLAGQRQALNGFVFGPHIKRLHIKQAVLTDLSEQLWTIPFVRLEHCEGLKQLPSVCACQGITHFECINTDLEALPDDIHQSGCASLVLRDNRRLVDLPLHCRTMIANGTLRALDLRGTGVPLADPLYEHNIRDLMDRPIFKTPPLPVTCARQSFCVPYMVLGLAGLALGWMCCRSTTT